MLLGGNNNKKPKNQETDYIRNAVLYGACGIVSAYIKVWIFAFIFIGIAAFYAYMAYKHFGEPSQKTKNITIARNLLNRNRDIEDDDDNFEFGNLQTNNKAYNAQKHWNELERAYKEKNGLLKETEESENDSNDNEEWDDFDYESQE